MKKPSRQVANGKADLTLTNAELLELNETMRALEGVSAVVDTEDGKRMRGPVEPYRFTTNPLMYLIIAKNQNLLAPPVKDITDAQQALIKTLIPKGETGLDPVKHPAKAATYVAGMSKLSAVKVSVSQHTIKESDLDLENNPISPNRLSVLLRHGLLVE